MAFPALEVIEISSDDDDPPRHADISGCVNNSKIAGSHSLSPTGTEPPAKRVKLNGHQNVDAATSLALAQYTSAASRQAVKDDARVNEAVLRDKLHAALLAQFETQVRQHEGKVPGQLHFDIIGSCKEYLARFVRLPECRSQALPAASLPLSITPRPPYLQTARPVSNGLLTAASPSHSPSPLPNGLTNIQQRDFPRSSQSSWAPKSKQPEIIDLTSNTEETNDTALQREPPAVSQPSAQLQRVDAVSAALGITESPALAPRVLDDPTPQDLQPPMTTPSSVRKARPATSINAPTSPQNFRSRAKAAARKSGGKDSGQDITRKGTYFALEHRPYVSVKAKEEILRCNGRLNRLKSGLLKTSEVFHVDITPNEVRNIQLSIRKVLGRLDKDEDPYKDIAKLLKRLKHPSSVARLAGDISPMIDARKPDDLRAFFDDILHKRAIAKEPQMQQMLSVEKDEFDKWDEDLRESRLSSLLLAREVSGARGGFGAMRCYENFQNEFRKCLEEGLEVREEFSNCAGDVSTISWVSSQAYIAGTTTHMDSHNQQYNKPGNLVLGSVTRGFSSLKAYSDHRIIRPIVDKGENSTEAMRESQDPWLYTSVVSSDYDRIHDRTYTSGFDKTVKVWKVDKSGDSMRCIGTWNHEGLVNFVQASSRDQLVATAADVPTDAVRVYRVNEADIERSSCVSFSCSRIMNSDGTPLHTDKWAYFPSTIKWGIEESVNHLLLVGYSPRSRSDDDNDIPVERLNTGELCLWDARSGDRIQITSAKTQNVFEVLWHPTQPVFIAATSPTNVSTTKDYRVKTQVRIFRRTAHELYGQVFSEIKALDCAAIDINELTIMPNSVFYCYVTAGCTNGKTYVWDTAVSDRPIHELCHGPAVEGVKAGDHEDDTGVKFTAWGKSLDHFYTGSSDGLVKVWNVRTSGDKIAKGRVVLEAAAQISFGSFSPDKSKLIIGDASGRVFVLSVDEDDGRPDKEKSKPAKFITGADGVKKRRPTVLTPHMDPDPPSGNESGAGHDLQRAYLDAHQLRYSGDPTVGMVQGRNYASTGIFRKEAHLHHDPKEKLFAFYENSQQENHKMYSNPELRTRRLRDVEMEDDQALMKRHETNCLMDLKFEDLSLEIRDELARDGVGQRELVEGVQYPSLEEEDEVELRRGKVEIVIASTEEHFWV